jgi:Holliday junction DNA helicase RuvA
MYSYLKGTLVALKEEGCLIEVQGVGYHVFLPQNCAIKLPSIPSNICLHVSFVIREFSQNLYGFLQESERDIFEMLLDISGVGPKLSLSIVGALSPGELKSILLNKDVGALCKIPGIGKKTAERLLLEVKTSALSLIQIDTSTVSAKHPPLLQDAISALVNLGYNQSLAQRAVTQTFETYTSAPDISDLITDSLRNM